MKATAELAGEEDGNEEVVERFENPHGMGKIIKMNRSTSTTSTITTKQKQGMHYHHHHHQKTNLKKFKIRRYINY